MPKKDILRRVLSQLEDLRDNPTAPQSLQQLRPALAYKSNHVVARAAEIIAEHHLTELEGELIAAFNRFMLDPIKTDPGCSAKIAIIEALYKIGCNDEDPFLQGIQHVQLEPAYGGKQDTAAPLRAFSALGLAHSLYPEVMLYLADLLADPELDARLGAVRAIAASGQRSGIPLLRYKALVGDQDLRVTHECLRTLLGMDPEGSLAFVAAFLEDEDEALRETAALALGESRLEGAFEVLHAWCQEILLTPLLYTGLTAMALLRTQPAIDYLISLVADSPASAAREALTALQLYQDDAQIWQRVEKAAGQRSDLKP